MSGSDTPSDPGQYVFLPWFKWGIGSMLTNKDPLHGQLPAQGNLGIILNITDQSGNSLSKATVSADLYGPGNISNVVYEEIVKTEPRDGTTNFEPDYFAALDFKHPDFPWLFTPAASSSDKLRPWLVLVVLAEGEFDGPNNTPSGTPAISVHDVSTLPPLDDSWAWAHTQVSTALPDPASFADAFRANPEMFCSRLICPRHLSPNTNYSAFLVPAFDIGVQAGLGGTVNAGGNMNRAWGEGTPVPLLLPCYQIMVSGSNDTPKYQFNFTTGAQGDFESLIRKLNKLPLPKGVGYRMMDVGHVGMAWVTSGKAGSQPLPLGGALSSQPDPPVTWPDTVGSDFQNQLAALIDFTSPLYDDPTAKPNPNPDPIVMPPLYGRWYVPTPSVPPGEGWVRDLNLDPRRRGAAGLGAHVVRSERAQLLASAWAQFDGIQAANDLLNRAQMGRAASVQTLDKHFASGPAESLLAISSPVLGKMRASPRTVRATMSQSPVSPSMLSAPFRRVVRPRGAVRTRQRATAGSPYGIIAKVNATKIAAAPPYKAPQGMVSLDGAVSAAGGLAGVAGRLGPWLALLLIFIAIAIAIFTGASGIWGLLAPTLGLTGALLLFILRRWLPGGGPATPLGHLQFRYLTPTQFKSVLHEPSFTVVPARTAYPTPASAPPGARDSADAVAFRRASAALATKLQLPVPKIVTPTPVDMASLRATILQRLDPAVTIPLRVATLIQVLPSLNWNPGDPLQPIMVGPTFPQPMYVPLRDWSQDWLLPNVSALPPNSMTLIQEDHAFIGAYMLGLNQEMGRQLLFNGFPTDQRWTYFRQFWDVTGSVGLLDPTQRESFYDIPPIPQWATGTSLGRNTNRPGSGQGDLVLLIRGDLFLRYPNTIVYAVPAVPDPDAGTTGALMTDVQANEVMPLYHGTMRPDLTFMGFPLTRTNVDGTDPKYPHGWFFVFQQVQTEMRFGLEPGSPPPPLPVKTWAELSWADFPNWQTLSFATPKTPPDPGTLASPMGDPAEDPGSVNDSNYSWGTNSAHLAYICVRRPERVAILATELLPPKT